MQGKKATLPMVPVLGSDSVEYVANVSMVSVLDLSRDRSYDVTNYAVERVKWAGSCTVNSESMLTPLCRLVWPSGEAALDLPAGRLGESPFSSKRWWFFRDTILLL